MIKGVIVKQLRKFLDERGWLVELFREDELGNIPRPAMSYLSLTLPGELRGPHEHAVQTDYFCFIGPSNFKLLLWDNRRDSSTYGDKQVFFSGRIIRGWWLCPPVWSTDMRMWGVSRA